APIQVSPLLPAIPGYIFFSVSLFLLIVYFNKQECPKKSGYLTESYAGTNGRLLFSSDANGNTVTYGYTGDYLSTITSANGDKV
ncbi:RHS repeat domain-containing protein, partial [Undibacterium sp. JH2W]